MFSILSKASSFYSAVIKEVKSVSYPESRVVMMLIVVVAIVASLASVFFVLTDFLSAGLVMTLMKL